MRFSQSRDRRGHDDMDATVIGFQGPTDELGQPGQLQALGVKPAPTAPWDLSEKPAQMDPDVQQKEAQRDQHEAIGGIVRGRPAADFARASVARFNAETAGGLAGAPAGGTVPVDADENIPLRLAVPPFLFPG